MAYPISFLILHKPLLLENRCIRGDMLNTISLQTSQRFTVVRLCPISDLYQFRVQKLTSELNRLILHRRNSFAVRYCIGKTFFFHNRHWLHRDRSTTQFCRRQSADWKKKSIRSVSVGDWSLFRIFSFKRYIDLSTNTISYYNIARNILIILPGLYLKLNTCLMICLFSSFCLAIILTCW